MKNVYPGSLHNHSDFSNFRLRDSINTVKDLINRAIELGHEVIAFTEHETIANCIRIEEYYEKIKNDHLDFKVIRGNEIYLVRDGLNAENFVKGDDEYFHFILLAKDAIGHKQIRELSTRAWMRSYSSNKMTRVPTYYSDLIEIIGKNPGHVIGSSACLGGRLPKYLLQWRAAADDTYYDKAVSWCKSMVKLFGKDHFYLEFQPSFQEEQVFVNAELIKLSKILDIPFTITCDAHYLDKDDAPLHKAFLNAQDGEREVDSFYATTYLMSDEEIRYYLEKAIGTENLEIAYANIQKIKNMCSDYSLKRDLVIPRLQWVEPRVIRNMQYWLSKVEYLNTFLHSEYKEDVLLAKLLMNKFEEDISYQTEETYQEVNECLKDTWISSEVNKARWSAYYLNLQKIVDTCWEAGSLVGCGRGSGVGFILLNMLGITQINPLREKTATKRWRFLNPERVSVMDVDIDVESCQRERVLRAFREKYGNNRVANVLTLGTEQSKSAILTAARGLGIDVDIARGLSAMIVADRGQTRTLAQTFYGDEEEGFLPNKTFRYEMEVNYPDLWKVAQRIEGLVVRVGVHAGGVIFVDEDFTETAALMRAPSGEIITQLELHDAEKASLIKYDILSVEALDKIHQCLDLLEKHRYIEGGRTLKDTYEKTVGIYSLERDAEEMWKMVWEHKIIDLFQMEKQSGIKGIATLKPTSVDDLATLNSTIRLMVSEKGAEMPTDKLARFKKNPNAWDQELKSFGLGAKEKRILEPILGISYGLCITQEQFMELVQLPELGGFSLTWADRLRKSIAKKNPAEYEKLTREFYDTTEQKNCNPSLCKYVWDVLIAMSRGYGFNASHTLAYSLVGLQEMNLAYRFPAIFWDTACLICSSGSAEEGADTSTNYTKLAKAIGNIRGEGIPISLANINTSDFGFTPDIENNRILFGLKGLMGVGDDVIYDIIQHRPYTSPKDFLNKVNPSKSVMIALIKAGAFDEMMDRKTLMAWYIWDTCDKKTNLTLQNMASLIKYNLLPTDTDDYTMARRVYEFNRYLKAICKSAAEPNDYILDVRAMDFLSEIECEKLISVDAKMNITAWDSVYQGWMDVFRKWLAANKNKILEELNTLIFKEAWDKYAKGTVSAWEMEVLCFYYHDHELKDVNTAKYGISDFTKLPEEPEVERTFRTRSGNEVNIYKLTKLCGTCIAKDKAHGEVALLTTSGVVTVKFSKEYFAMFDKQISVKQPDGKKQIVERSWFKRGSMIVVQGMRSGEMFMAKNYESTGGHTLYKIEKLLENGDIQLRHERYQGGYEEDEEI